MSEKTYSPEGKDNILISNIMLWNGSEWHELHIGGIVKFDDLIKRDDFWKYLKDNVDKEVKLEMYTYCLYGKTGVTRDATEEELNEIIDDEFPNNPIYRYHLSGEDNESEPYGYTLKPTKHCAIEDKIQVIYYPVESGAECGILYEDFLRNGGLESEPQNIQSM